jgi:hypothetical protein
MTDEEYEERYLAKLRHQRDILLSLQDGRRFKVRIAELDPPDEELSGDLDLDDDPR